MRAVVVDGRAQHDLWHGSCLITSGGQCVVCQMQTGKCVDRGPHASCIAVCTGCWAMKSTDDDWLRAVAASLTMLEGKLG